MNYFYNQNGQNQGPVTFDELRKLAGEGTISGKTPVIEEGGAQWTRYAALDGSNLPSPPSGGTLDNLLNINDRIDRFLARILRVPAKVPQGDEPRLQLLGQWGRILSLVVWAAFLVIGLGLGSGKDATVPLALSAGMGLTAGFFAQYVFYQMYAMTSSLLVGQKIVLSSMAHARLLAMLSIALTLVFIYALLTATGFPAVALYLCLTLLGAAMVVLFFNADQFLVSLQPGKVSPGREFNNVIRLVLRGFFFSFHLITPVAIALAALAMATSFSLIDSVSGVYGALYTILLAPVVTFFGLCVTSWIFDLFDSLFALGEPKRP